MEFGGGNFDPHKDNCIEEGFSTKPKLKFNAGTAIDQCGWGTSNKGEMGLNKMAHTDNIPNFGLAIFEQINASRSHKVHFDFIFIVLEMCKIIFHYGIVPSMSQKLNGKL